MADVIQLALGAFMSSLGVKGHTKSWEAHECDQQLGENARIDIGKSQTLPKDGNARINMASATRPSLAEIIENVCISKFFENPKTDSHIAGNVCCIAYTDAWSSEKLHWLSKSQAWIAVLPVMDLKTRSNSKMEWLERPYWLQEFTRKRLNNQTYSNYRSLFTTQDEWTMVVYVMDMVRPFRY